MKKKLIIAVVSNEFFKSNLFTLNKEQLNDFDLCCINYAVLYQKQIPIPINYFFSGDYPSCNIIFKTYRFNPASIQILYSMNPFIFRHLIQPYLGKNIYDKIKNNSYVDLYNLYDANSGLACILYFALIKQYKEIHLIGLNGLKSSGNFLNKFSPGYVYDHVSNHLKRICLYLNDCIIYITYEKSSFGFLPSSNIFHTNNQYHILKNSYEHNEFNKL